MEHIRTFIENLMYVYDSDDHIYDNDDVEDENGDDRVDDKADSVDKDENDDYCDVDY